MASATQAIPASAASVPFLDGTNFSNWIFRIFTLMEEKDCRHVADNDLSLDQIYKKIKEDEKFKKGDAKAKSIIVQSLKDKHLEYIKDSKTSKEMVQNLRKMFERKSTLSKLYLRQKLLTLKHQTEENLEDHFNKFDSIIRELEGDGKLEETDKVCHLLLSIDNQLYQPVITALEAANIELTLEYTKRKLLDAELRHKNQSVSKDEFSFTGEVRKCYKCGETNHFIRDCPKNRGRGRARGRGRGQRRPSTANLAEDDFSFIAYAGTASQNTQNLTLVIDSGATYNMINENYMNLMEDIQEIPEVHIKVANGEVIKVNKKGKLKLKSQNNMTMTMEALIVRNLSHNLISVKKLSSKGCEVIFKKNTAVIKTPVGKIKGKCDGSLYILKCTPIEPSSLVTKDNNTWHMRLGHLNRGGMKILGLPQSDEKCSVCMKAKAARNPFNTKELPRTKRAGELIYCDIGSPLSPETNNEEKYYLTIIDDYTHFTEVYILKYKSQATEYIVQYLRRMEANGITVTRIRTDNGGEFQGKELKNYCNNNGIKQEYTCSYTPQQNGVAERLNRTLMDKARALFLDSNLPKYLWGEALRCATYQLNRSPTVTLKGDTPANAMYGITKIDNLVIFGSKAWVVNLPKKRKLEPRASETRMVGYSGNGYRLWNPETDEIVISRDVKFDENDFTYEKKITNTNRSQIYYEEEEYQENTERQEQKEVEPKSAVETRSTENDTLSEDTERPKRQVKPPSRYNDFELNLVYALITEGDPLTYEEAIEQGQEWQEAINKEIKSLQDLEVWTECSLPEDQKAIETKWVFRTKQDRSKKARLVAKGFQQDNMSQELYSPVAKMTTIRLMLSQAITNNWEIRQLDVPSAFLNSQLDADSEVYIKIPEGVNMLDKKKVLKLRKALYGLKESPRCWNETINKFCESIQMKRSTYDVCLYTGPNIWLVIFVDDILLIGDSESIDYTVQKLKSEFKAKDMGYVKSFLAIDIERNENTLTLSQERFINKLLQKFNMSDCNAVATPMVTNFQPEEKSENKREVPYRELVGSLTYLSMMTRPDITFATSFLSRYLDKYTEELWKAGKRILKYLKGTKKLVLTYKKCEENFNILAFTDADWAGDKSDRKSTSGMAIFHGDNLISWSSKKQVAVALSTAESEYVAAAMCAAELMYIKGLCSEFGQCSTVMFIDNNSAIKMISNYENTKRSKHIDIKLEQDGFVVLEDFLRPAECDELKGAGISLTKNLPDSEQRAVFSTTDKNQLKDAYFLESNDKISYFFEADAMSEDGKLKVDPDVSLNKVGHALHLLDPIFRCYTYSDRVKTVCRELGLKDPAVVQSMYIYKNPGVGGEVVPHQDATYLHTEPIPPIGFWIALEDSTIQNGCLWMARGSHKSGVHRRLVRNPEGSPALVYDRSAPIYPQSSFTAVPVSKGTCILIHGLVVHKSAPNKSEKSRHAYTFHVVERNNNKYSPDNWLQEGPNAPFCNMYTTPQIV